MTHGNAGMTKGPEASAEVTFSLYFIPLSVWQGLWASRGSFRCNISPSFGGIGRGLRIYLLPWLQPNSARSKKGHSLCFSAPRQASWRDTTPRKRGTSRDSPHLSPFLEHTAFSSRVINLRFLQTWTLSSATRFRKAVLSTCAYCPWQEANVSSYLCNWSVASQFQGLAKIVTNRF